MSDDERESTIEPGSVDPLARALREAGPRPGIPGPVAERLRAATLAALERKRAGRRTTHRVAWLAAAAAIVLMLLAGRYLPGLGNEDGATAARVERVVGAAAVVAGSTLAVGERIATGPGQSVALRASTGHAIRLGPDTSLRFSSARTVELAAGRMYVDSGDAAPREPLSIVTPLGRVEELGTRYQLQLAESSLSVRVRGGRVGLGQGTDWLEVGPGAELTVHRDGAISRSSAPLYGEGWEWVLDAASAPEIDGRRLGELLDWVLRETGWSLEFTDAQTAARAPDIVLRGGVEGLGPDEALATTLPTCGLAYRVESARLIVGVFPEGRTAL